MKRLRQDLVDVDSLHTCLTIESFSSGKTLTTFLEQRVGTVTSYLVVVPLCVGLELLFPTILASLSFPSAVWNGSVV